MIHVDHGGNIVLTKNFFDKFFTYNIPIDMIGFSFYPWSHGTLLDLRANLAFASQTYDKDVMVVETGVFVSAVPISPDSRPVPGDARRPGKLAIGSE